MPSRQLVARLPSPLHIGALVLGVLVGFAYLQFTPIQVLMAPIACLAVWLITVRPEIGLLAILALVSTVVSEESVPLVPIGIGSLHLSDLIVIWLLLVIAFRIGISHTLMFRHTALDLPILLFVATALVATVYAVALAGTDFHEGVRELRYLSYYLLFFIVTNLVQSDRQLSVLYKGIILLALVTAGGQLLQAFVGPEQEILPGRVEHLVTQDVAFESVPRVIPPGESLIYSGFILVGAALLVANSARRTVVTLTCMAILGLGLILTYRRMLWATAALSIFGVLLLAKGSQWRTFVTHFTLLAAGATLCVVGILYFLPDSAVSESISATIDRLLSVFDTDLYSGGSRGGSLDDRRRELEHALPFITPPSIFGIGLGTNYIPCLPGEEAPCGSAYIHSGHVSILLKLGILGYGAYLWMSLVTIRRGLTFRKFAPTTAPLVGVSAFTCIYASLLVASILEPYFVLWNWVATLAILLGCNEVLLRNSLAAHR